ncbi:unnamed protein product [Rodentolepis nana]|uniref:Dynein assembly factor 1, axonemal homolog n=1 Tax=Rodentolepis nana TaxID=102285 RepID=A0A0R3TT56_RODNA|nr:unnamed protein product [Rodentolepis nana]
MNPNDRKKVEYLEDQQFAYWLRKRDDLKKKKKKKAEKPLVRLLPLIEALRNNRFINFQKLYVWSVYLQHNDMMCLGDMLAKGNYQIALIDLTDCFLDSKALSPFAPYVNYTKTLRELVLDFNEFGDSGCQTLYEGLKFCRWLVRLSLCFCGLNKQSGVWLGNLVANTSIRELYLDGNNLEADGVSDLLYKLSEAAYFEAQERERLKAEKIAAAEAAEAKKRIDLDALPPEQSDAPTPGETTTEAEETPKTHTESEKRKSIRKKKKQPPCGPQITHLHLAENNINNLGRGGSLAPPRCMQYLKTQVLMNFNLFFQYGIIAFSKDLQEVDLFGNDIGQVAGRIILEGILERKDNKLPRIGMRVSHLINQDTFDMIRKLAPKPKGKRRK